MAMLFRLLQQSKKSFKTGIDRIRTNREDITRAGGSSDPCRAPDIFCMIIKNFLNAFLVGIIPVGELRVQKTFSHSFLTVAWVKWQLSQLPLIRCQVLIVESFWVKIASL